MITIDPIKKPIPNIFGNNSINMTEIFNKVDKRVTEKLEEFKDNIPSGNGVPIVDSEEKLETLDLPQGSLASVAYDTLKKVSFRDLYQPTTNDLDQNTGAPVNPDALSKVDKLEFTFPEGLQSGETVAIYLIPKTFSMNNTKILMVGIEPNNGAGISVLGMAVTSGYSAYTFCQYDDNGVPLIYQENIDAFNELLTTDDWRYFGYPESEFIITEAQFDLLDKLVKPVSGVQGTDLYIRNPKGWVKENPSIDGIISLIPTKSSQLVNDSNFITLDNIFNKYETLINVQDNTVSISATVPVNKCLIVKSINRAPFTPQFNLTVDGIIGRYALLYDGEIKNSTKGYIQWSNGTPPINGLKLCEFLYLGQGQKVIGKWEVLPESYVEFTMSILNNNFEVEILNYYANMDKVLDMQIDYESVDPKYKYTFSENKNYVVRLDLKEDIKLNDRIELADPIEARVNLKNIHQAMFQGSYKLTKVTLENCEKIGSSAFSSCPALRSIVIPPCLKEIGSNAFSNGRGKDIYIEDLTSWMNLSIGEYQSYPNLSDSKLYLNGESLTNIEVPNSFTAIRKACFAGFCNVDSIICNDNVRTVETYSFAYSSVKSVQLNADTIGDRAFYNCESLQEIISDYSTDDKRCYIINDILHFFAPSGLSSYVIPDNVSRISDFCFGLNKELKTITLNDGLRSIGNNCFYNSAIEYIKIPSGVTYFGSNVFDSCSNLVKIEFEDFKATINANAIYKCTSLEVINFSNNTSIPRLYSNSIYIPETCKIVVPDNLYDQWIVAENWSNYASQIVKSSEYVEPTE